MALMGPTVDIVIAAHNEAALLGSCLDALRRQDYPADLVQVIVSDDRSTDGTRAVAVGSGCVAVSSAAPGPAAARNAGIRAGRGSLVGFLDAHAVPALNWISALVQSFADPRVGGCQARLVSRASDPRVDAFVRQSAQYSGAGIVEQTVAGTRTLYPWMLSGNCMYRRTALEDAGLFDERLVACEDVDLGWRVVLAGYLLDDTDATEAVHVEGRPWGRFITKGWTYGRGASSVARAYAAHGAAPALSPGLRRGARLEETLSGLCYWAGYRFEAASATLFGATLDRREVAPVRRWRDPFVWTPDERFTVSPAVVYWFRRGGTSVIVDVVRRERLVLDGAGNFIWRRLAVGASRGRVIEALVDTYGIAPQTAEFDLDDFFSELAAVGVVLPT